MKKMVAMLFVTIALISSVVFAASVQYTDLSEDHWAYGPISEMTDKGILDGYTDGSFKPNKSISRAEFAKILVLTLDLNGVSNEIII